MPASSTVLHRPRQLARLLTAVPDGGGDWTTLARHRSRHPLAPAPGRAPNTALIDLFGRAGLTGRGGAGFLTARKLRAVAAGRGPRAVIVNGAEGEPASGKDRVLLGRVPHLVLDGALFAAAAVGASMVVVCVDRAHTEALAAVRRALAERFSELARVDVRVVASPSRYVSGESSALVQWLDGGPAVPTLASAHERGLEGRPTLVQNVETVAHMAQIAGHGAEWFRSVGTADEPGTTLVTVSGAVVRPSVIEVAMGTPVAEILAAAGGTTEAVQALLLGGYFGAWAAARTALDAPYSRAGLAPLGAGPGAGVVVALPVNACGLAETARVLAWFAGESAGQCGPCVFGLPSLAATTAALARGEAGAGDVAGLRRWADQIDGRGACRHPDGAVALLRSALTVFAADVDRHAAGIPCAAAAGSRVLRVPAPGQGWR
jgi:NADH:ubiquinone oxidoreductase subunit F (NADH-binding)